MNDLRLFTGVLRFHGQPIASAFVVNLERRYLATCRHVLEQVASEAGLSSIEEVTSVSGLTFHLGGSPEGVPVAYVAASTEYDVALVDVAGPLPPDLPVPRLAVDVPNGTAYIVGGWADIVDGDYTYRFLRVPGHIRGDATRERNRDAVLQDVLLGHSEDTIAGMSGGPVTVQVDGALFVIGIQSERYRPPEGETAFGKVRWIMPIRRLAMLDPASLPVESLPAPTHLTAGEAQFERLAREQVTALAQELFDDPHKLLIFSTLDGVTRRPLILANPEFELLSIDQHTQSRQATYEKVEDIVTLVLQAARPRLALIGPAGSGKSTTLKQIAHAYCRAYLDRTRDTIPVMIDMAEQILDHERSAEPLDRILPPYLRDRHSRVVLLIDGIDQLQPHEQTRLILWLHQQRRLNFILTCRAPLLSDLESVHKIRFVEILPLSLKKVFLYLRDQFKGHQQSDRLIWKLAGEESYSAYEDWCHCADTSVEFWDPGAAVPEGLTRISQEQRRRLLLDPPPLLELVRNPYMLTMVAAIHLSQQLLPSTQGGVIRYFVRMALKRGQQTAWTDADDRALHALAEVAYSTLSHKRTLFDRRWAVQCTVNELAGAAVDRALAAGMIDGVAGGLRFRHALLQSLLASFELVRRLKAGAPIEDYLQTPWWKPGPWSEALTFLGVAGGSPDNIAAWLGNAQPEIAGRAFVECSPGPARESARQAVRAEIKQRLQTVPSLRAVERAVLGRALSLVGDDRSGVGFTVIRNRKLLDMRWALVPAQTAIPVGEGNRQIRVNVPAFRIGHYLVTNQQYQAFVQSSEYHNPQYWSNTMIASPNRAVWFSPRRFGYPFDLENHPVVGVSWHECNAFCLWLSQQLGMLITLPTIAQWTAAAQSASGTTLYAYGDHFDAERCNARESKIGTTTAVGIFPHGMSRFGLSDCNGNVWEYCEDSFIDRSGRWVAVRGGAFTHWHRCLRNHFEGRLLDTERLWDVGFRVVTQL